MRQHLNDAFTARVTLVVLLALAGSPAAAQTVQVVDIGVDSGFQDVWLGHHKRGRANVAADFDLDGRVDFFIGNPGDESFVVRNVALPDGSPGFQLVQVLVTGGFTWGGAAADYDNDGDYDLFIAVGGNEGIGFDYLFKNMWIESGETALSFVDVSEEAGVRGPVPPGFSLPIQIASANAVWGDFDRDGHVDLFVNGNIHSTSLPFLQGRNILWRNEGDGTFTDVTDAVGLGFHWRSTRHSTWLDFDNDGDLDLFENNHTDRNLLWRNRLVETGSATFEDVTSAMSPQGEDLGYPLKSFASAAADFDNDGYEDLILFMRGDNPDSGSPYAIGHALFINQSGTGFVNVAASSGLNDAYIGNSGVMGCQVGDLNGDGVPDVFLGNGGPPGGEKNQLFLSDSAVGASPHFTDRSDLIDFAAPVDPSFQGSYPPYPYRTHGTAIVDADGDGLPEMAVTNGGRVIHADTVREPNRLFRFDWTPAPHSFRVRLAGDGARVSRDAIGARVGLTVSQAGGTPWQIRKTLFGGSGFSGQNGFELLLGLGGADTIHSLDITWPDGFSEVIDQGLIIDGTASAWRDPESGSVPPTLSVTLDGGQITLSWQPSCGSGDSDYVVYEGTTGGDFSQHSSKLCSTGGETSVTFTPKAGGSYYLVAPRNLQAEGSCGTRSDGTERPAGSSPCLTRNLGSCG